jgi:murein DD-endopeptidase MepM/ murein hydrolase activator NlpD
MGDSRLAQPLLVCGLAAWLAAGGILDARAAGHPLELRVSAATIPQGGTVEVRVLSASTVQQVTVRFAGRTWRVYAAGQHAWRTIVGTDPRTTPGRHAVIAEVTGRDGVRVSAKQEISVTRVAFATRRLTFDPDRRPLLSPEAAAEERRRVTAALRVLHPEQLWTRPLAVPVDGPVSSPYGVLSVYHGQVRGFHGGVDIAAAEGTPVRAAADGIVRLAEALPLSGNAVLVDHGLGVVTSYLHMSAINVRTRQRVSRGDLLGQVGSTGLATGPHLHWGLRVNGVRVDPMHWTAQ